MDREAMQMALEALVEINKLSIGENAICLPAEIDGAMDALRQALETKQEPVAHVDHRIHGWPDCLVIKADPPHTSPLYTSPPKREWVGLTDEEIGEVISGQFAERNYWVKITKALESKLKEKNT